MTLYKVDQPGENDSSNHTLGCRIAKCGGGRITDLLSVGLAFRFAEALIRILPISRGDPVNHQLIVTFKKCQKTLTRRVHRRDRLVRNNDPLTEPGNVMVVLEGK